MRRHFLLAAALALSCTTSATHVEPMPELSETTDFDASLLIGNWRVVMRSPGGELPFTLTVADGPGGPVAEVANGSERLRFSSVTRDGDSWSLRMDGYDSEIRATVAADGASLRGTWSKTIPGGLSTLDLSASRGDERRFVDNAEAGLTPIGEAPQNVSGAWSLEFEEKDGSTFMGRAELDQDEHDLTGTIMTDTGDYRFLAGRYEAGWLQLSVFDGAHVFLFRAEVRGDRIEAGHFWSRDSYHAEFRGRRLEADETDSLGDPWKLVRATDPDALLGFAFPDLDGKLIGPKDAQFRGKVLLIDLVGSWCPNCNDQASLADAWHERYRDRGFEVIALFFEFTGDEARDREFVAKFGERHGLDYTLLLAGISDKADASERLPGLSKVACYPTSIFVDRSGRIRGIYSGFFGPATGDRHTRMVQEHEALIETLLAETP